MPMFISNEVQILVTVVESRTVSVRKILLHNLTPDNSLRVRFSMSIVVNVVMRIMLNMQTLTQKLEET